MAAPPGPMPISRMMGTTPRDPSPTMMAAPPMTDTMSAQYATEWEDDRVTE